MNQREPHSMAYEFQELAVSTFNEMMLDKGVKEAFLNSTPADAEKMVIAYAIAATKKRAKITAKLESSPAKMDAMVNTVYAMI